MLLWIYTLKVVVDMNCVINLSTNRMINQAYLQFPVLLLNKENKKNDCCSTD